MIAPNHPRRSAMRFRKLLLSSAVASCFAPGVAWSDDVSDLKAQMQALQKQLDAVKGQLDALQQEKARAAAAPAPSGAPFIQLKPDSGATFLVPGGGEVQLYGHFDVSFDYATKGLKSDYGV